LSRLLRLYVSDSTSPAFEFADNVFHFPEISSLSRTEKQGTAAKILYPVIACGSALVIVVVVATIFCLRKRCLASGRPTSNARTQSYGAERNVGHDNPLYGQTFRLPNEEPEYLEIGQLQQPSVGFPNPHFDPRDHYQPLDNPYGRSNHVYGRINLKGERGQSEV